MQHPLQGQHTTFPDHSLLQNDLIDIYVEIYLAFYNFYKKGPTSRSHTHEYPMCTRDWVALFHGHG